MPQVPSWLVSYHDRYGRLTDWVIWSLVMLVAAGFYAAKAAEERSAFVRWRHQVNELWKGENIYNEMMFPNPPMMPITLRPLMMLPPLTGALAWFAIKVGMVAVSIVLCFRMVSVPGRPIQPWAEGLVLILSQRPILSDLHHGNINIMILFLIVGCLYAWRKNYDVLAGLILALAITYKVTPALFVPYFMYKRSWRTVGATMLGLGLFFLVLPSLVLGVSFNAECLAMWWHRILSPYLVHGVSGDQEINQSMVGVLNRLFTELPDSDAKYARQLAVNVVSWDPAFVGRLIKAISIGLVALLAFLCRTKTNRRDDARLLGEFSLVVLTMLFVSERSWKHHFVTLLLPYAYLVYRAGVAPTTKQVRTVLTTCLALSVLLIAATSSELGGVIVKNGHKLAQAYGMFFWAGVVLYIGTAWRVYAERKGDSAALSPGRMVGGGPHFTSLAARRTGS